MAASLEAWGIVLGGVALLGRVVWFAGSWFSALAHRTRLEAKMLREDLDASASAKKPGFH